MKCVIGVALHTPYRTPQDPLYLPIMVGAALRDDHGLTRDDTGDHISQRNPTFSELTAQYWLWKNAEADVYGLCHYRRYFAPGRHGDWQSQLLTQPQLEQMLQSADVLLPRPRIYLIETNHSQYIHSHHQEDLKQTRLAIERLCPEYLPDYDRVMKRRWGRRFNMFVMRREQFFAYSQWLFSVLFEVERRLDVSDYTGKDTRVFGYIAERLMDVWIAHHSLRVRHVRVLHLEGQQWPRRIATYLRRKIVPDEKLARLRRRE